eukprot:COSAG06_NODE_63912_length_261_cov_0.623457_2_plen_25_part_01
MINGGEPGAMFHAKRRLVCDRVPRS